jgi:RNA polymerase primary sigma factor
MAQVPGVTEAGRRARELHRRARRLLWRLALSGLPQVEHALHRASTRVPREALRQAGVMGLYRAACRFEPRRGLRLSTYCRYWVREAMQDLAGRLDHVTRLPASARRQLRADPRELSARQAQALDRVRRTVRFEAPTPGKGDQTWSDVIADPRPKPRPDVIIARRRRARRARHALDVAPLDARERDILAHRLELDGAPRQSFRELGARHEVSGERVRQVFNAALSRLEKALAGGQPRGEG